MFFLVIFLGSVSSFEENKVNNNGFIFHFKNKIVHSA